MANARSSHALYVERQRPSLPSFTNAAAILPTLTHSVSQDTGNLPELPTWFIHAFFGACTFVVVVAFVLLLVQFPGPLRRAERWVQRSRTGHYHRLMEEEVEMDVVDGTRRSSSIPPTKHGTHFRPKSGKRLNPNLSIDTSGRYVGLGIAIPGHTIDSDKRGSEIVAVSHGPAAMKRAWTTAPLARFSPFLRSPQQTPRHDRSDFRNFQDGTPRFFTPETCSLPHYFDEQREGLTDSHYMQYEGLGSALIGKLKDTIVRTTDQLVRRFNSRVTGPEDGLLLPVREEEREWLGVRTDGIFVD